MTRKEKAGQERGESSSESDFVYEDNQEKEEADDENSALSSQSSKVVENKPYQAVGSLHSLPHTP